MPDWAGTAADRCLPAVTFLRSHSREFIYNMLAMSTFPLLPGNACWRCCIKALHNYTISGVRHVSRTSAINRGLRATKGPALGDRRPLERATSSRRNDRDRRGSKTSPSPLRPDRQPDIPGRRRLRRPDVEKDDQPLAFRRRDKDEPKRSLKDNDKLSFKTKANVSDEKASYSDWLAAKRSEREKRAIRAWQEEDYARKRDGQHQRAAHGNRDEHELKPDARKLGLPRKERDNKKDDDDGIPEAIPYSTAASQFLYGTNTVLAALRAKRRQLYALHLRNDAQQHQALALAKAQKLKSKFHDHSRMLDRMSDDRPHNGVVLEASSIPTPSILAMGKVSPDSPNIPLYLSPDAAVPWTTPRPRAIGASQSTLSYPGPSHTWRQPFIVFLDGITDPGNVGSILRTAHFFGVDAVAIATNTCANINSPVLAKASAGACEAVPILSVSGPASFIHKSAEAGWKIYAAVAPEVRPGQRQVKASSEDVSRASSLAADPVILMLGAEGEGLRENLRNKAHVDVSIPRPLAESPGAVDVGVDSMNVGVAAGVLIDAFMRQPQEVRERHKAAIEARESEKMF